MVHVLYANHNQQEVIQLKHVANLVQENLHGKLDLTNNMELEKQKVLIPNIFQAEALEKLDKTSSKGGVVVLPTGTGKTFLASLWFRKKLELDSNAKLLFICHNKDILSQANETEFQGRLKDLGITYGYYNAYEKDIKQATFGTTQTLTRNLDKFDPEYFDYIIVDEAHHYQAKSFKKVLQYFKPKFMLGLTATPNRTDNKNIFKVIGKKIYEAKIGDAIKKNLLSKINYWCVDNDIDFSDVKWNGNKYDKKDLNRKLCIKEYDDAILKEYNETLKEKFQKKKTICFCATVEHTHRMAELFNENGIRAIGLTSKSKKGTRNIWKGERNDLIKGFKQGDYDIIFVRDLFNEGVDIPDCDSIMMLRPTQSHTIFTQQIGRGLRKAEGKEDVLILDFTGNARNCVINFEVLGEIMGKDIIETIRLENKKTSRNEINILSIGCNVRLTKKKYNVIHNKGRGLSRQELIKRYKNHKERLGRVPMSIEMTNPFGRIYKKRFGSWNKFLKIVGDYKDKNEIFKKYFIKLKREIGRVPTKGEIYKRFGKEGISEINYTLFLKSINEDTTGLIKPTKEEVINNYWKLKNKTGKQPICVDNYHGYYYTQYWKSYNQFLREIGEPVLLEYETCSKEEIIGEYFRVKKKLGRQPTVNLFSHNKKNKIKYNEKKIVHHFGSWKRFLKEIGEPLNQNNVFAKDVSSGEMIENIYALKKKLKRNLRWTDLRVKSGSKYGVDKYRTKFGLDGMREVLKKVNGEYRELNIPTSKLIKELKDMAEKIGHIPKTVEVGNRAQTLKKKLGMNWEEVIKLVFGNDCKYIFMGDKSEKRNCLICNKMYKFNKKAFGENGKLTCSSRCNGIYKNKKLIGDRGFWVISEYKKGRDAQSISKEIGLSGRNTLITFLNNNNIEIRDRKSSREAVKKYNSLKTNIKITKNYKPIITIPKRETRKSGEHAAYPEKLKQKEYKTTEEKVNIREKIISNIQDGDNVLLLESPELSAIKEIEKQNIKPKRIVIPNNKEFKKLAEEIQNYKTDLNIEIINTSLLQYLVDSEEKFDFVWMDYCGAFSYYIEDLDILFKKHFNEMKLILTYNLFDPAKEDDSYYFTKVIDYVLDKISGRSKIRLINDITYRYKKQMYNIGFNITEANQNNGKKS